MSNKIGYKNPPKHTRFKPGVSANPKGRPRREGKSVQLMVNEILFKQIELIINGKKKKLNAIEISLMKLVERALKGDPKAMSEVVKLGEQYGVGMIDIIPPFLPDRSKLID